MYCKKCGKIISNDSIYCKNCGAAQDVVDNSEPIIVSDLKDVHGHNSELKIEKKQTPKRFLKATSFVLLSIIFLLTIVFCFKQLAKKSIADISIDKVSVGLADACNQYDEVYSFHYGLAKVKKANLYGFIDKLGNEIISCKYDNASDFSNGKYSTVSLNEKNGIINCTGSIVIPIIYDEIFYINDDNIIVNKGGQYGLISINGNIIINMIFEECHPEFDGMHCVKKNGKYGFICHDSGQLLIPFQYDDVQEMETGGIMSKGFNENLCGVKKDGLWRYIDRKGQQIIKPNNNLTGEPFSEGLTILSRYNKQTNQNEIAFINPKGEIVSDYIECTKCSGFHNGYCTFFKSPQFIYGPNGEILGKQQGTRPQYGIIDHKGNWVVPYVFDYVGHVNEDLVVVAEERGNSQYYFGVFDLKSSLYIVPCILGPSPLWILSNQFNEGLLAVQSYEKVGFVDCSGTIIIPYQYDYADDFSEGFAVVKKYGKFGFVDRYGNDTFDFNE